MVKIKSKKNTAESIAKRRGKEKKKSLNPFEVHINKEKQKILGRKNKADRGLPGTARAKAINKRKNTLLHEYKVKDRNNAFLDRRIGERNSSMTQEDKNMARFAAEKMKAHKKKSIFNLNEDEVLTHKGQTLAEIEKFDDPKSDEDEYSDEENRTGKLDKKFVGEAHFGGGILSRPDAPMSRKDLIDQLVAESKKRKAEKQKLREQTMDLTEKLDSEWKDLLPIVATSNKTLEIQEEKPPKADDYDIALRELKFEARGIPSDRLKSEEEIAKEEKERLEELEANRLARMKGVLDDSNSHMKHKSADDLDDGFAMERIDDEVLAYGEDGLPNNDQQKVEEESNDEAGDIDSNKYDGEKKYKKKLNSRNSTVSDGIATQAEELESPEIEASEDESEVELSSDESGETSENDNLSDLKASEDSSEDEQTVAEKCTKSSSTQNKDSNGKSPELHSASILKPIGKEVDPKLQSLLDEERAREIKADLIKRKEIMEKARQELPYTYKAPESFEELQELLDPHNPDYQSVIVERIIKCNHQSLGEDNKEKLANLFTYLLQYLNDCALEEDAKDVVKCFQTLDRLSPHLYDLAQVNPLNAKICIQEVIKEKHEEFEKNQKKYPGLDTLIFLKLVSLLFPTSDFRHPVVTPTLVFLSQVLLRCRVRCKSDISKGLFVSTLMLEYTLLSKRLAPSVINFLRGIIYMATPKRPIQVIKVIPPFKSSGESSNLLVLDKNQSKSIDLKEAQMKATDLIDGKIDNEFRMRAFITAVNLLDEFRVQLKELDAAYLIFEPIVKLLNMNHLDMYPDNAKKRIQAVCRELEELKNKKLEYIVRAKKKPKPLRLYEPRIERVYDGKKHKPMSKAKAEMEKLLHKYKREMKGAVREVRRDNAFLAKVQIKQHIRSDEERKRKVREIFGDAAAQQSELNQMKRKKSK